MRLNTRKSGQRSLQASSVASCRLFSLLVFSYVSYFKWWSNLDERDINLSLSVCGGASNQILSIAFVLVYAITNQVDTLVAPSLNMNGRQLGGIDIQHNLNEMQEFIEFFDWDTVERFLNRNGIAFTQQSKAAHGTKHLLCRRDNSLETCTQRLSRCKRGRSCHVHMQCPFLHRIWDVSFVKQHKELFNQALSSLVPSDNVRQLSLKLFQEFNRQKRAECTTFVHVRVENDWQLHCESWAPAKDEPLKCLVSIPAILDQLHEKRILSCALFLAYDADDIDEKTRHDILTLKENTTLEVFDGNEFFSKRVYARELRAAVNVAAAVDHFDFFIGNSVSTMSALIIRQRRMMGLWAAQYNRGTIPLSEFVPGYSIPWVFTLRGTDVQYDEMMKVAVRSAIHKTSLLPYSMVHPDERHFERVEWLRTMGVQVCIHRPIWEARLLEILHSSSDDAKKTSHLYSDPKKVLGTYFRLDLAILPELLQFEHVLYTDTDVLFTGDITTMQGDGLSLPSTITLAIENPDIKVLNAGVYFASLRFLRDTYEGLIETLMTSDSVSYGKYGPGDQGLLNKYYETALRKSGHLSDMHFNAKSYDVTNQARIVHFHGPKPLDYDEAITRGSCAQFPALCARGLKGNFFCTVFNTWIAYCELERCSAYKALKDWCHSRV